MRFISTRTHGVLDYLTAVLLIAAPWLFDFADNGPAQWVPIIMGIAILGMSIMTDYELGLMRSIPMATHLTVDVIGGIFLAASPWLFGFADQVWAPHLIVGLLELGAGLTTERTPTTLTTPTGSKL
ncbi:MAG: SPW repeat protein [Saprospiraceae bacterium]